MTAETIPALVEHAARVHGRREAVAAGEVRWTFARLRDEVETAARAAIAAGVRPGDRAAIWAPNGAGWIVAALGLVSAGAVLVPLNTRYRGAEAADVLRRSRASALFTVRGFLGNDYPAMLAGEDLPELRRTVLLEGEPAGGELGWAGFLAGAAAVGADAARDRAAGVRPDDIADIVFTSGTTGRPKGAMSTHDATLWAFRAWSEVSTLRAGDRYLLINPFFHTFGYKAGILACLLNGATMLPEAVFDAAAVAERLAADRVSVLLGPPTIFTSLLELPDRPAHRVRLAGTGAADIPVDLIRRIRGELGVPHVFTAYGLSEAAGVVSVCPVDADAETVARTSGPALPGTEIRIAAPDGRALPPGEQGEIRVRGRHVMRGYLDDPEATARAIDADGRLRTGDLGRLDARGYLTVTGRLKDMFVVGGFNAYPAEIESVLVTHPAVVEAAVLGVPDARLGEVGAAWLVTRAEVGPEELTAWLRERLANFKVPRHFHVVDALPRNAGGKVVKDALRRRA
ncbi:FadD3 family acyl-CoA ligase [Actinomadura sp. WAC 06369]|uniref:FadD3 family acyl-CoA ligase n=1 Tax=Actinomadura sp. WAC 06369 TaxID=2203193 RepID=UPI000F7AA3E6|nr:FadD3 family acyl-CoA ligase [Actinomadura sp. WAC 06369]RSN67536.1 fatty acid--CoA ligase [Actinomadura sp. WAC 06369]